jgi:hypothetical protein
MPARALEAQITALLAGMNALGGYPMSLVCTDQGLLLAAAGEPLRSEIVAALTSLFDDIVVRAGRDLELSAVDEISVSDASKGHLVVRPLTCIQGQVRLFLVVQVPRLATWRRNTNLVARKLLAILRPWLAPTEETGHE